MGFLVIGIDRNTGAAVLLTETPLPSRNDAIDALETLAASDQSDLASYDIVLVDLDAGIPVVVVQQPQAPAAATPELGAPAADAGPPADEVAFAADAFTAIEEPPVLAEPETVGGPVEEEPAPPAPADAAGWESIAYETVPAPPEPEPEQVLVDDQALPSSADDEQGLLDALRRAADSLVQQGIEVPEPGGQEAPAPVEAADAPAAEEAIPIAEPMGVVETPPAEPAPSETDLASIVEPVRPVIMGEYPETVEPAEPQPYQPAGDLEIAAYTCDDCVYSNTCPKAGESSPADCGTFQWRSF